MGTERSNHSEHQVFGGRAQIKTRPLVQAGWKAGGHEPRRDPGGHEGNQTRDQADIRETDGWKTMSGVVEPLEEGKPPAFLFLALRPFLSV